MVINKIYLDMDGVIVDFVTGVEQFFDKEVKNRRDHVYDFDYENDFGCTRDQFWSALTEDFWANLPAHAELVGIMEILYSRGLEKKVCILSKPGLASGFKGKAEWLRKNLPHFFFGKQFLLGFSKDWMAYPDALLIDDYLQNCKDWMNLGGQAFLFPRQWNCLHAEEGNALQWLEEHLDYLVVGRRGKL